MNGIEYFEDLEITGTTCPPKDAYLPDGKKEYYRVVKHNPATTECFFSHRKKYPAKIFDDECEARYLSTSATIEILLNSYFRTPAHKKKTILIAILVLKPEDGLVKQTYSAGHYSWWRSITFDPNSVKVEKVVL